MKNTIGEFPWVKFEESLQDLDRATAVCDSYNVSLYSKWLLPQVMAYVGSLPLTKNDEGKYDAYLTLRALSEKGFPNFQDGRPCSKAQFRGIVDFLRVSPRGLIMPKGMTQRSEAGLRYCAAVPLFLSAFLEYRGITYDKWDTKTLFYVVDSDLYDALTVAEVPQFSYDELMSFRKIALLIKSRSTENHEELRKPLQATRVPKTGNPEFDELPKMARMQLVQLWVFSPDLANQFGIYVPGDLIKRPTPLVDKEVMEAPLVKDKRNEIKEELVW
jgi:hypothetical protein